jgi:hypothetical protein
MEQFGTFNLFIYNTVTCTTIRVIISLSLIIVSIFVYIQIFRKSVALQHVSRFLQQIAIQLISHWLT